MTIGFEAKLTNGEREFYKKNIGNAVNLFGVNLTMSRDLVDYNHSDGKVTIKNFIERKYNEDGSSQFWENPQEIEIDTYAILSRTSTTKNDRLGRIENYNRDLMLQELEQQNKLNFFSREPKRLSLFEKLQVYIGKMFYFLK